MHDSGSMRIATILFAAALVACAHGGRSAPAPVPPDQQIAQTAEPCPTTLDDVRVRDEIIEGGAALVFYATDSKAIGELRARVRALAAENPAGDLVARVEVVDTSDGARLEIRPEDPAQIGRLRDRVADAADELDVGTCTTRVSAL
jgi:hypothetical protein